jgi:hypothetical protein
MSKFQVSYNGKIIGYETADTEASALKKLVDRNPHHIPEKFILTELKPVMHSGALVAHQT